MLAAAFHDSVRAAQMPSVRAALVKMFGSRKYRITKDGEIHAHGLMPNTNQEGWYLFGDVGSAATMERLGL